MGFASNPFDEQLNEFSFEPIHPCGNKLTVKVPGLRATRLRDLGFVRFI